MYTQDEEAEAKLQKDNMNAMSAKEKLNMSSKEIDELLKRGAHDVFIKEYFSMHLCVSIQSL
jgi:hypothetical protein